jgi:hypothetical protein
MVIPPVRTGRRFGVASGSAPVVVDRGRRPGTHLRRPLFPFDPTPYGNPYAGFTVDPTRRLPPVRRSRARDEAIARTTALARRFDNLSQVVKAPCSGRSSLYAAPAMKPYFEASRTKTEPA